MTFLTGSKNIGYNPILPNSDMSGGAEMHERKFTSLLVFSRLTHKKRASNTHNSKKENYQKHGTSNFEKIKEK